MLRDSEMKLKSYSKPLIQMSQKALPVGVRDKNLFFDRNRIGYMFRWIHFISKVDLTLLRDNANLLIRRDELERQEEKEDKTA